MTEVGRIPRGPRALLATALVALATCTSVLALSGLIQHGRWLPVTWLTVLVIAAVVAGVRALARSWWMPSLVGLVVTIPVLLVRYGAPPGRIQVVPDLGSLHRTIATAREGIDVVNASLVPMPGVRSAELLVVTGAVAVFLLADALAVGLGVPAWSGLAFAALWVPAVVLGFPAGIWPIALTAVCYLLLLALSVTPTSATADRTRRASTALAAAVGLVVVTIVVGPAVAAFPGWASVALPSFGQGPVGPLRLSEDLDLRDSLGKRSQQAVLTYTVTARGAAAADAAAPTPDATDEPSAGPTPASSASPTAPAATATAHTVGPLRAFTLTGFDGRVWDPPGSAPDGRAVTPGTVLSPDPSRDGTAPNDARGTLADVSVQIRELRDRHLPISTFDRALLDVGGSWRYAPSTDTVTGDHATTGDMRYSMTVEIPTLTADDLRAARPGDPGDGGATLDVPQTDHSADIAARAREITRDAKTPYDEALALQQYFRSAQNFTYDTRVAPARTDDAVWDFLQNRHGYCVQFATSMVVMARDLGIPARLGVGFLPGDPTGDDAGTYTITGHDSHAWPELYFQGFGWVRFEPTPAIQTGAPPVWSDPFATTSPGTTHPDEVVPTTEPTVAPGQQATGPTQTTDVVQGSTPWLAVGLTTVLVLLIATIAVVLVVRRRMARGPALTPERAWARARRRLADLGITWSDADTPRTASAQVQRQVQDRTGEPLPEGARSALDSLAATVERTRYAPSAPEVDAATLEAWLEDLLGGAGTVLSDRTRRGAVPSAPRAGS